MARRSGVVAHPCLHGAVVALAALAIGAIGPPAVDAAPAPTARSTTVARPVPEPAPARGPADAPVTVELFCAFAHAGCAVAHDLLERLAARHPRRLRVLYRIVVLPYRDSALLAEAGHEAWRQGRFFDLARLAFAVRGLVTPDEVLALGRRAGLDPVTLAAALSDRRHAEALARDAAWRDQLGVVSVPSLVWNGVARTPPLALETLEGAYDDALAEARARLRAGVPPGRLYETLAREAALARASSGGTVRVDPATPRARPSAAGAPARGPVGAPVTIVAFTDLLSAAWALQDATLRRLEELYPGRLRIVVRALVPVGDANTRAVAEVAACAHRAGRFWPMHDRLVGRGPRVDRGELLRHAAAIGLDLARLRADLDAGRCARDVDGDLREAKALRVTAAPTLFVNGLPLRGVTELPALRLVLDEELRPGWIERATARE